MPNFPLDWYITHSPARMKGRSIIAVGPHLDLLIEVGLGRLERRNLAVHGGEAGQQLVVIFVGPRVQLVAVLADPRRLVGQALLRRREGAASGAKGVADRLERAAEARVDDDRRARDIAADAEDQAGGRGGARREQVRS